MQVSQLKKWLSTHWVKLVVSIMVVVVTAGLVVAGLMLFLPQKQAAVVQPTVTKKTQTTVATTQEVAKGPGLNLDTTKDYGNKYKTGILPVGDQHVTTDAPKQGYIYACSTYFQNLQTSKAGASSRGPWFVNNDTEYDINQKLQVQGTVAWDSSLSNVISAATRTITTNDLPTHTTGIFPIGASDPAHAYDANPNTISAQSLVFALAASPTYSETPQCMSGVVGVMLTGVQLNNAFDAGGRDAGAWEIQDSCGGHPQQSGEYHYHSLSSCIKDVDVTTVIGFALDGFPITGPNVNATNILTTSDLDECHGISSAIILDGKSVTMYHYVMTQDFPYSVSCFRGTPISPPGQMSRP